jgi:hypothetical protein
MPKTKLEMPHDAMSLTEISAQMGDGYSISTLRRMIKCGELRQNREYFRSRGGSGLIKISLSALRKRISELNGF